MLNFRTSSLTLSTVYVCVLIHIFSSSSISNIRSIKVIVTVVTKLVYVEYYRDDSDVQNI